MTEKELWEKCVEFHGHVCGGLTIGYKAALYARRLLEMEYSPDEEIVCVTENDACGVDAIQVILGCSVGKGNLLFRIRGKQVFSFFRRSDGRGVRLCLKETKDMSRDEKLNYLTEQKPEELFDVSEPQFSLPKQARIFQSICCEKCNEMTAEHLIRLQNGKKLCLDCFEAYDRFGL